jgi:hypothetical protein
MLQAIGLPGPFPLFIYVLPHVLLDLFERYGL